MQARAECCFIFMRSWVTLCPLISKAVRSAESVPPGPPIKFNGLSAVTSKSLYVQLFANRFQACFSPNPPLILANNALSTQFYESSMWNMEGLALCMQTPWLSSQTKTTFLNEVPMQPIMRGQGRRRGRWIQANMTTPSKTKAAPPSI